jgi:hypothetical protein
VFFYFDESGDYAFPDERFDCYVRRGVICPDSALPTVDQFVRARHAEWGIGELHATELEPTQRLEIARFIGGSDCQLLAHLGRGRSGRHGTNCSSRAIRSRTH